MVRIMSGLLIPEIIDYSGPVASKFLADGRQPLRIGIRWPDRTLFLEWPLTSLRRRQCNDDQLATMVGLPELRRTALASKVEGLNLLILYCPPGRSPNAWFSLRGGNLSC